MFANTGQISGQVVDLHAGEIYPGTVQFDNGIIQAVKKTGSAPSFYILPGFIDAHIHIESSMLLPYEFARVALCHGTVATVSDPHEIANVCGMEGVYYMIENAKDAKLKFNFGAPSCVPATSFESAGAELGSENVKTLLKRDDVLYLSEMMNYPGVLNGDKEVLKKIAASKKLNKPVDGHAPGLRGNDAKKYIEAGISTDHECFTREEALDKIKHGMKIIIREGSAARNFEALCSLMDEYPELCMLCSDDKHPDELAAGHINELVKRAFKKGLNKMNVLRAACLNPVLHYKLNVGLLQKNDPADFIVTDSLQNLNILKTVINGEVVAENGKSFLPEKKHYAINNFSCHEIRAEQLQVPHHDNKMNVIEALDGQLITNKIACEAKSENGFAVADAGNDILKMVVLNRYRDAQPAVCFVKNFGIKSGAIASSVAHDSHNIIAVGCDDESICRAVNLIITQKGGLSAVNGNAELVQPLPVAGLMSTEPCPIVAVKYSSLDKMAKQMGSALRAPFMTLSFMALLVIPKIKLSDKGLFDAESFNFIEIFKS